jgi:adenylate kinase
MINIVLFGKPGAGKGTQANFLKSHYQLVHISTGDVFRYNIKNATDLGKLAQSYMDKGDLVPDEVTINMLKAEVEKNPQAKGFIFDGFPRTTVQAEILDQFLITLKLSISMTIALEVDENLLIERLISRGKDSGRSDDQDRTKIQNRFDEYNKKTSPLINYYKNQNKFFDIDGVGDINEISSRIFNTIDNNI